MSTFVKVAKTHDLVAGDMGTVLVRNTEILLAQVQGQHYAINNVCSHISLGRTLLYERRLCSKFADILQVKIRQRGSGVCMLHTALLT
jgi:nitrite reductase/ring-hydroxylating ferredoxin subunit